MSIFDLRITLYKIRTATNEEFQNEVKQICTDVKYCHLQEISVKMFECFACIYISDSEKEIAFGTTQHIMKIIVSRGDFSEECGIDVATLSRVFEDEDAVTVMFSKLRKNSRYIVGSVVTTDKAEFTADRLRQYNWDGLNSSERYFVLRRMLVDLKINQRYDEIWLCDEYDEYLDMESVCNYTVEELFGPDAKTVWSNLDYA